MNDKLTRATRGELAGALPGDMVEVTSERGIQTRLGATKTGPRTFFNIWLTDVKVLDGERIDTFDIDDPDAGEVYCATVCKPRAGEKVLRHASDKLCVVRVRLDAAIDGETYADLCISPKSPQLMKQAQQLTEHQRVMVRGNGKVKEWGEPDADGKRRKGASVWVNKLRTSNVPDAPEGAQGGGEGKEYLVEVCEPGADRGKAMVLIVAAAGDPEAPLLEMLTTNDDTKAQLGTLQTGDIARVVGFVKKNKNDDKRINLWVNAYLGAGAAPSPDAEPTPAQLELYSAEVHADGTEAPPGTDDAPEGDDGNALGF
jgi:hypothetical protein